MGNQVVIQEKPIHEQIRDQRRNIDRSIRNIEREKRRVEAEEKKTKREIKKMAANNQLVSNRDIYIKIESSKDDGKRYCPYAQSNHKNE